MSVTEEWERLKAEVRQDADRLIQRATIAGIRERIQADAAAILRISDPENEQELTSRHKIFDLLRKEWRTNVMDNKRFSD